MQNYINDSRVMDIISKTFIIDSEFKELVYGLGLTSDEYLQLSKKDERVYYALSKWCKKPRTVEEFIQVLRKIGYLALIEKLDYSPVQSNTMNNWSVKQIAQLANDAAAYWESVAAHLNIDSRQIKASVHAGATPCDYSRKLFEGIQNRCMSEDEVKQALIASGNKRLADQYFGGGSTFSAPGGVVVGSFSGGSITVNNSRLPALSPSIAAFHTPNNDFNGDELTLYNREFDSGVRVSQCFPTFNGDFDGGNPFNFAEKKDETMTTFVNSASPFYTKLCGIMDEGGDWKTLAKNYGVLNNPAAAKLVLDLSARWEKRQVHPTDHIFKLLTATPHGKRTLDQLSDDLLRIDNPQIVKWVNEWNDFRQKQDNAIKDTNTSIYNANVELRKFLLQHKISKTENVDSHLARLTNDNVGVSEPEHLKMMEYSDFIAAGFNIIESKMFVKAISTL